MTIKKTIYDDRSEHWESLHKCSCGGHVLSIDRWIEKSQGYQEDSIYMSFWFDEGGDHDNNTLWNRIKNAWSCLIRGGYHKNEIILDKKDFDKLVEWYADEGRSQFIKKVAGEEQTLEKELLQAHQTINRLRKKLSEKGD